MNSVLRLIYPPRCIGCNGEVGTAEGLCGTCRAEVTFISGLVCQFCGVPLPGDNADGDVTCDDCLAHARPWVAGRSAIRYRGKGRSMILAFKHSDRTDLARPMARWLLRAAQPILPKDALILPVPIHWVRMVQRRYNQAALLARELAHLSGHEVLLDGLVRARRTRPHEHMSREERFANMTAAIHPRPGCQKTLRGRRVLIVDDVMTSGATLTAAAEAALTGGAAEVRVATLARVAKDT